jgi:hypothetical protein
MGTSVPSASLAWRIAYIAPRPQGWLLPVAVRRPSYLQDLWKSPLTTR